jgi:hypothetical protein
MAEPTQYSFELSEVVAALIKHQGLHEGKWTIGIEFNMGAALAGPSPADARPTAIVAVNRLQLTQPPEGAAALTFTVDAASVNPAPKTSKNKPRQAKRSLGGAPDRK